MEDYIIIFFPGAAIVVHYTVHMAKTHPEKIKHIIVKNSTECRNRLCGPSNGNPLLLMMFTHIGIYAGMSPIFHHLLHIHINIDSSDP